MMSDYIVEVRNSALARLMQIPLRDLSIEATATVNAVGEWTMLVNPDATWAPLIQSPGAGIVVTRRTDGFVLLSGPMTSWEYEETPASPNGTLTVSGVTDEVVLRDRLAYPDPAVAVGAQTTEFDPFVGSPARAISHYVDRNLGAFATQSRRHPAFVNESTSRTGPTYRVHARFETLLEIAQGAADFANSHSPASPLVFSVRDLGGQLTMNITTGRDRRDQVRLSVARNSLTGLKVRLTAPATTDAIVGGDGDGVNQELALHSTPSSRESGSDWGRYIETFVSGKVNEAGDSLASVAEAHLATAGSPAHEVNIVPSEYMAQQYGVDWAMGDLVSLEFSDGATWDTTVTGFGLQISSNGIYLGMQVSDTPAVRRSALAANEARVSRIERRS